MTMLELKRGEACEKCGDCNHHLRGLSNALARGKLFINTENTTVDWGAIDNAIIGCKTGALRLEGE